MAIYLDYNASAPIETSVLDVMIDIYKIYSGNIGKGIFIKELKKMNQRQIINNKNNKEFLNKTLKDIFSDDISGKFTCFLSHHNKNLIQQLLNEEDNEKKIIFQNLFSLTFMDCLNHFRGTKKLCQLDGIITFADINKDKDFKEDEDYFKLFQYYIFHFEEIIMKKRQRNKKDN